MILLWLWPQCSCNLLVFCILLGCFWWIWCLLSYRLLFWSSFHPLTTYHFSSGKFMEVMWLTIFIWILIAILLISKAWEYLWRKWRCARLIVALYISYIRFLLATAVGKILIFALAHVISLFLLNMSKLLITMTAGKSVYKTWYCWFVESCERSDSLMAHPAGQKDSVKKQNFLMCS